MLWLLLGARFVGHGIVLETQDPKGQATNNQRTLTRGCGLDNTTFLYYKTVVRIHPSAFKHGITEDAIKHGFANPVKIASLDQDHEPAKVLVIGSDAAGNLLELVV